RRSPPPRRSSDLCALGLANLLHDDLLGGLRGNAAELDGFDFLLKDIAYLGAGLAGLLHVDSQLMSRIIEVFLFDDSPATEGFVASVLPIDFHTQVDFVFEARLGSAGQSLPPSVETHPGRYALLIGHRPHNQQYFFAHRTPRLSQSIGSAGSALNRIGE